MKMLPVLLSLVATCALAEDLKMADGREIKNATVKRAPGEVLIVETDGGVERIHVSKLATADQLRYGYDAARCAKDAEQSAKIRAEQKARDEEAARKYAELHAGEVEIYGKVISVLAEGVLVSVNEMDGAMQPSRPVIYLRNHPLQKSMVDSDRVAVTVKHSGKFEYVTALGAAATVHAYDYVGLAEPVTVLNPRVSRLQSVGGNVAR